MDLFDPDSIKRLVRYYVRNQAASYYTSSGNAKCIWFGKGARALGLEGEVTEKQLENIFMGKSPDGREQLVRVWTPPPGAAAEEMRKRKERAAETNKVEEKEPERHVPGYDITFSLPKSVAVLWALGGKEIREMIERIFLESVKEVLQWFEENVKLARRGKGGEDQMLGELVIALTSHDTARNNQDPLPHIHAAIANILRGIEDGKWSKVNSQQVMRFVRLLGPIQQNTFLKMLDDAFGVKAFRPEVEGKKASWFELDGISKGLTSYWSSRRKELMAEAELSGIGRSSSAKARQNANLRTRKPKGTGLSRGELEKKWVDDGEKFGVTQESLKSVIGRSNKVDIEKRIKLAIDEATEKCLENGAHFTRQRFIQHTSESLQDVPISGLEVVKRADAALQQSERIKSFQSKQSKELIYTTKKQWDLEEKLLSLVEEMKKQKGPKVSKRIIERTLRKHPELSPEQAAATRFILETEGGLCCIKGVAGAGKTYIIKAVKYAYEAAGFELVGTALSGSAARELGDKGGIETKTLAMYKARINKSLTRKIWEHGKHHVRMIYRELRGKRTWRKASTRAFKKKQVLLIDESGMSNTEETYRTFKAAKEAGIKVIPVGDDKQLGAIGSGGPFSLIASTAPSFYLSENFRQRNAPEDAQAAADLREGEVEKMLENYVKRGRLKVARNRDYAAKELVKEWSADGHSKRPERAIILTQSKEEARQINRLCQAERLLDGNIKKKAALIHGTKYHVGDRVLFRKQLPMKGILNGYQGTVVATNSLRRTITIKLDRKPTPAEMAKGHKQTVELSFRQIEKDMLTIGYAATTHAMQGQSRQAVYCLFAGAFTNLKMAYTQITRGSEFTKLFTDRHSAGRKLVDLADAIRKPGTNDLAHEQERGLNLRIEKKGE